MRFPALLILACALAATRAPAATAPAVTSASAPVGAESLPVGWREVRTPGLGTFLLAEARPAGRGPFPAVVLFHGTHGFAREYVQLAKELSKAGVVAIAACWFAPGQGQGTRFVTPLKCPAEAPPISSHQSKQAVQSIDAILQAVRSLPEVDSRRVAIFGHSRGAGLAWNYILQGGKAQAVILNSSGYPDEIIQGAGRFGAPVLLLHGERDGPADGGSPMTDVRRARSFEAALKKAGRPVEAAFYPAGGHNSLFSNRAQHDDEVRHITRFLRQHLSPSIRR